MPRKEKVTCVDFVILIREVCKSMFSNIVQYTHVGSDVGRCLSKCNEIIACIKVLFTFLSATRIFGVGHRKADVNLNSLMRFVESVRLQKVTITMTFAQSLDKSISRSASSMYLKTRHINKTIHSTSEEQSALLNVIYPEKSGRNDK